MQKKVANNQNFAAFETIKGKKKNIRCYANNYLCAYKNADAIVLGVMIKCRDINIR